MNFLSETWFIEGNLDFEYKKYTLLAYLQRINRAFGAKELYPQLADLIFHYRNLQSFRKSKELLKNQFPKKLTGIQLEQIRLLYEEMIADDDLMLQIEEIVLYAMKQMEETVNTGTQFYDVVEQSLAITPVGILPPNNEEGYFFLCDGQANAILVYEYQLSIFSEATDRYRTLRSQFVREWTRNFVNTYDSIKKELVKARQRLNLPAVYAIESNLTYPIDATLLPVAKRSLVRYLSATA